MKSIGCYLAVLAVAAAGVAGAEVTTKTVEYEVGGVTHRGFLAWDSSAGEKPRPGVLVVPEWWGLNDFAREQAQRVAGLGYVAFAADMYGEGKVTTESETAGKWAGALKGNRPELRRRAQAALETLAKQPQVDPDRLAAIGYCFGGTTVLELARAGADLDAVVSFHGGLDFPDAPSTGSVRAKSLVLHGAADPLVPEKDVEEFLGEMKAAGAEVEFVAYPEAVHSFTNPKAGSDPSKGVAYNAEAARKSWEAMKEFLVKELKGAGEK